MKKKAKKLPKYQVAGQNPCGEGTVWDDNLQKCVPDISNNNETSIIQSDQINDLNIGTKNLHFKDNKGTSIPYQDANTEAITQDYNYDSDGVYRKNVWSEDKNKQQFSGFFQALNPLLDLTQLVGNVVTDFNTNKDEQKRLDNARYQRSRYNIHEAGHNNVPVYLEFGGKGTKHAQIDYYPYGGGPLTAEGAKEILRDGTVHGKPLTDKQKRYFGYIAGGGKPNKQIGGLINTTGYLKNAPTRTNPINIIPSGNITTQEMAFPIVANGVPLYPNTGDYKFNSKYVVEHPMQQGGGVFKSQAEIDAANAYAKGLSVRKGLVAGENAYVARKIGDPKPQMIIPPAQIGVKQQPLAYTVPSYVQRSDIQTDNGTAWYNDPQTGNSVLIDMSVLNQPRFRKTDEEINTDIAARKLKTGGKKCMYGCKVDNCEHMMKYGGIHINPKNKGKFTATKKATGKTTEELTHSKNPLTRKRAIFAQNAKKWHHYQDGGDVPEVEDSPKYQANGMLEQGEVFQTQNGQIQKVSENEDRHEAASGGSPQAGVSRVLEDTGDKRTDKESKLLLVKPEEVKAMFDFKPKRSVTHSKLYEKVLENDAKDIKGIENKIKKNLEYAKNNGGIYAQNSLEENLKLLMTFPTKQERFNKIYNHQEAIKDAYNIDQEDDSKYGGKMKKYQTGGENYRKLRQDKYTGKFPPYPAAWSNYYDTSQKEQYKAPDWITPEEFYTTPGVVDYMNTLDKINGVDNDLHKADDAQWGYRHQAALEKFFPNGKPQEQQYQQVVRNSKLQLPKPVEASTVNEGLGWSAGYGNLLGLVDSFGRIPVPLEQLDAQPVNLHEEDVRPVINANLSDYNSAVAQLPQNGVGYANMANLQGQKYRADNQAVAAVESRNKQKADQIDTANAQMQFQIDQANLQLRDQFNNRVLTGKEKQRQQKFEYLNGLFKAIDERNAFNRNANLALQVTPYFDQYGKFNNQKYQVASKYNSPDGQTVQYIEDKQTGQQFRVIYDKDGKLISSSKVIADNKGTGNYKVSLK